MESVVHIAAAVLLSLGALVALTGGLGVIRMPDFYTRCHCAGKGDSLAQLLIIVGLIAIAAHTWMQSWQIGDFLPIAKLVFICVFIMITSPTATHAVARGARLDGIEPWKQGDPRR